MSVNCVHCLSTKCRAHYAWCKCHVAVFLLLFFNFFIACFVVVLNVLVKGDLRHEYAQSTWGFLFGWPLGYCLHSLCLRRGNWCSFYNDCCCGMSIIMILTTSSWRLCCVCHLVAPRLIATALLIALGECSSCERFGASQWWRWLRPLQSVMASIVPIAIGDGVPVVACCNCA